MIRTLTILVLLQLVGEVLASLLNLPLPGGLVGMLLLLVGLLVRGRVSPEMQGCSEILLQNLMLLFIPFIAGILAQLEHVQAQWLPFVASCVLGAVLSLISTAWTLQWMLKRHDRVVRHGA